MIKMKSAVTTFIGAVEKDKNKVNKEMEKIKDLMDTKEFKIPMRGTNKLNLNDIDSQEA